MRLIDEYDEAKVKKAIEEANNWEATCRVCGEHIIGTLAEMRKHVCRSK